MKPSKVILIGNLGREPVVSYEPNKMHLGLIDAVLKTVTVPDKDADVTFYKADRNLKVILFDVRLDQFKAKYLSKDIAKSKVQWTERKLFRVEDGKAFHMQQAPPRRSTSRRSLS